MSDRMTELEQKFKNRNLLEELAYYANYPPKGYVGKGEVDLIQWAIYKAYQIVKGMLTMSSGDYISRDDIRNRLHRIVDVNKVRPDVAWFTPNGVEALIDEIHPADVRPVKWIPVTDRLPPEFEEINEPARWSEKVLFWQMGGELRIGWYSYAFNVWSVSGNIMTIRADYVTHWMPLLEPPEAEAALKEADWPTVDPSLGGNFRKPKV